MTKEEAREQMGLLKLSLSWVQKEIDDVLNNFCRRGDHCFCKLWKLVAVEEEQDLFRAAGYACLLCDIRMPLKEGEAYCPICNEPLKTPSGGEENEVLCSFCGFINCWTPPVGVPRKKIPPGDMIIRRF